MSAAVFPPVGGWLGALGLPIDRTLRLKVFGTVEARTNAGVVPAAGAAVVVGGFRTTTDSSGGYTLSFRADQRRGIAVLIKANGSSVTNELDVPDGSRAARLDVVLP